VFFIALVLSVLCRDYALHMWLSKTFGEAVMVGFAIWFFWFFACVDKISVVWVVLRCAFI